MSQTEPLRWEQLAGDLFDDEVVPLASAKRDEQADPYFPLRGDEAARTYFVEPRLRTAGPADFQPHRGNAEGLVEALTEFWAAQGEDGLASLRPRLSELAEVLAVESAQSDGTVDVLCYTLF